MRAAAAQTKLSEAQAKAADAGVKGMIDVGRPFLDFVISALADAGITDVCLVIGPEHDMIRNHYQSEPMQRVKIHFAVQVDPLGTANAVAAAEEFVAGDRFVVVNSDNYYPPATLARLVQAPGAATLGFDRAGLVQYSNIPAERIAAFAIMLAAGVVADEAANHSVITDHSDGARVQLPPDSANLVAPGEDSRPVQLMDTIIEKPDQAVLDANTDALISMNAWLFTAQIFDAIRGIELSERGEYEIADAVRAFLKSGQPMQIIPVSAGVLDMSRRDDIADVADALSGVEVQL